MRLAVLVLCGLVAVAPQLGPLGGEPVRAAAPVESPSRVAPVVEVAPAPVAPALAVPAPRACGGTAIEVQLVGRRSEAQPQPAKQPPRLGLETCH